MKTFLRNPFRTFALPVVMAGVLMAAPAFAAEEFREEFHKTYPLDASGRVRLENINGNVNIKTWERPEVQVDAVKKAKRTEFLEEVTIEVESRSDDLRIKTRHPESGARKYKNNDTRVDYVLTVPRQSRLSKISTVNGGIEIENAAGEVEASSVNGPVNAVGLSGETSLSTVNGTVKARFAELLKPVSINTVNGGVHVILPANAGARVSAKTVNGSITTAYGLKVNTRFPVGKDLDGSIGAGGPLVKMTTVNGGIRLGDAETERSDAR